MIIAKLEDQFFVANTHLIEVMDKRKGLWDNAKKRGYGIVLLDLGDGLRFGIPLRSNFKGRHGYRTVNGKVLDFSKAVLITDDGYIGPSFMIPRDEFVKIKDREHFIRKQFGKYVKRYIELVNSGSGETLARSYRYSTLQNYHAELGI